MTSYRCRIGIPGGRIQPSAGEINGGSKVWRENLAPNPLVPGEWMKKKTPR